MSARAFSGCSLACGPNTFCVHFLECLSHPAAAHSGLVLGGRKGCHQDDLPGFFGSLSGCLDVGRKFRTCRFWHIFFDGRPLVVPQAAGLLACLHF